MSLITSTPKDNPTDARKRLHELIRSPDSNICARCDKNTTDSTSAKCQGCKLKFCAACTEMSQHAFSILILRHEVDDYQWKCRSCKTLTPTLERIDSNLQELNQRQERRLTNLETKMDQLEIKTKNNIATEIQSAKKVIKDDLGKEIKKW